MDWGTVVVVVCGLFTTLMVSGLAFAMWLIRAAGEEPQLEASPPPRLCRDCRYMRAWVVTKNGVSTDEHLRCDALIDAAGKPRPCGEVNPNLDCKLFRKG